MARTLPTEKDLIVYDYAVAGHEGTLSDASGELFIKPCTPAEIAFYEETNAYHPEFADFMPAYLGTLELSEKQETSLEDQGAALIEHSHADVYPLPKTRKIVTNKAIVLENAAYGFKQPNILDVKLGVRLWADDAKEEKKIRFDKVTAESTHKDLGFRIAGMRVFQGNHAHPEAVPGEEIQPNGYKIYDKNYGRFFVNKDNVTNAFRKFIFTESAGVSEELGKLVIEAFLSDLFEVQKILESQESRMYSASLLFVFEGDGEALRFAMEEASKTPPSHMNGISDEAEEVNGVEDVDEDEDEDYEDKRPKIYSLKVIDFAHAQWTPGLGPDENALTGVRSVIKILADLGSSA